MRILSSCFAVATLLVASGAARADWKGELNNEHAANAARIAAIEEEAKPLFSEWKQVQEQIGVHNAHQCVAPADNPNSCASYDREAQRLNGANELLHSRLAHLKTESDQLISRNHEIERRLRCVPLPKPCKSNADCNECSTCGTWDGQGRSGICEPLR